MATLSTTTAIPSFSQAAQASVNSTKDFSIANDDAATTYKNLIKNKTKSSVNKTKSTAKEKSYLKGDFSVLNNVVNTNNKKLVYSKGSTSRHDVITYDETSDSYTLLEADNETGELIYIVDGIKFTIVNENGNINMYSENGNVLPLITTEYQNNLPNSTSTSSSAVTNLSSRNITLATTWGTNLGPFYRTNKVLVDVLGLISATSGVATIKFKHPILGIISTVTGVVSYVGDKAYATLYIKYYQAHDTSNFTYVKQTDSYYQYSNYTGFVKSYTSYFYSSKPY